MSWSAVQQVILTITPIAAILIARSGLNTWKLQLKGSHDFELSRRLLLSLYKYRDALRMARNPFVQPGESDSSADDWEASAYENRWRAVSEASSELRAAVLESEVSWNEDFKEESKSLHKLTVKLQIAIRHYLASRSSNPPPNLFSEKDEDVLYATDDDEYELELSNIVKLFENKIRPKIAQK